MGLFTKNGDKSPDIIYTQEFRLANGARYLGYTERSEALSPEKENDLQRSENVQNDPDVPKNYKGYLGYTDRKAATKMEKDLDDQEKGDYPTFTQGAYELSEKQHKELIKNLKEAQKNKSLLWAGVISFSPEFIEKSGLMYDDGTVNQKGIKTAVMAAMPDYLKAEGLNSPETFWWGDIHLNTNHVHVHLAISQKKNTRPLKNGQPKGMFHTKSIRKLKSAIHHQLANEKSRVREIALEKSLDYHKSVMVNMAQRIINQDQHTQQLLLNLQETLPKYKDKRRWRASNHSVDFKESRDLAFDLVDSLLKHQLFSSYQFYQESSKELDSASRESYGQHIKDTVQPRDEELRNRLVNLLFRDLATAERKGKLYRKDRLAIMEKQGTDLNKKIMDDEVKLLNELDAKSSEAKKLRIRLGLRRYYLKLANLDNRIADLQERIDGLKQLDDQTKLTPFINFFQEQQLMAKLEKIPKKQLSTSDKATLNRLRAKYQDVQQLPIKLANPENIAIRKAQLAQEEQLLKEYPNDPGKEFIIEPDTKVSEQYQTQQMILDLKQRIHQNNQLPKEERQKTNGPLFQRLKRLYKYKENPHDHKAQQMIKKYQHKQRKQTRQHRSPLMSHSVIGSFTKLLAAGKTNHAKARRAMHERLDRDDDLEREDELERREELRH